MEIGFSLPARRAFAVDRALAWRIALGVLVCASIVGRTWAAWLRATPDYFPDEYLYPSLSRSIAAGHLPSVQGQLAHFPALLQPILTAPAWWFGSLETGYRITQAMSCVAMSTAALAVWWTARRLGAGERPAFCAAVLAVAVPDVGYSGWLLSEPFAYPLFIAAVAAGATALARRSLRAQSVFLVLALLATFARIQLGVLLVAYLAAALVLRKLKAQRLVLGVTGFAVAVAAGGGLGAYRDAPAAFQLASPAALGRNALVLATAAGWIVVPAGLLGLVGAFRNRFSEEQRAFGALALAAGAGVLAEETTFAGGSITFERYGCYLLPLIAIGFALHAERGWPRRRLHAALAGMMLLASALVPMSSWAAAGGNAHSLVLTGLLKVEAVAGSPGAGSLDVALATALLSIGAVACAWRRATTLAAMLAVAFCVAASVFATSFEVQNSRNVRAAFMPNGPEWVQGEATIVAAPSTLRTSAIEQLFWNRNLTLDAVPGAAALYQFASRKTTLAHVRGPVVLDESGSAIVPAAPLRRNGPWLEARSARIVATVGGLAADGWIAPSGSGLVSAPGRISFTVTAPESLTLTIAGRRLHLRARTPTRVCVAGRFDYRFSSHGYLGARAVSARATFPRFTRNAGC